MGHACILISYWPGGANRIEVLNCYGFYGVPATTNFAPLRTIKRSLALDTDFWGNHGILKVEEMRFLDKGVGLNGVTFEINFEQLNKLKGDCLKMIRDQEAAMKEGAQRLQAMGLPVNSRAIYDWEKMVAQASRRESRLKPFELHFSIGMTGPSTQGTNACKHMAVNLLRGIGLPTCKMDAIIANTFPRYSGTTSPIVLHAEGGEQVHTKRSGQQVFFRAWGNPTDSKRARVYWSLPPQLLLTDDEALKNQFIFPEPFQDELLRLVPQLQCIHTLIKNTQVLNQHQGRKTLYLNKLEELYTSFAYIYENGSPFMESFDALANFTHDINASIWHEDDDGTLAAFPCALDESVQTQICYALGHYSPADEESVLRL